MSLTPTATRVADNTAPAINQGLRARSDRRVAQKRIREGSEARLGELEREWDIERAIETEAPVTILAGIALGIAIDRRFLGLSAMAAGMLLVHSLQGWYPLLPALRRMGFRSAREIADEAYQLKSARGDFGELSGDANQRARAAYAAAAIH